MTVRGVLFDLDETLHSREAAFWRWIDLEAQARSLDRQKVAELDARGRGPKALLVDYLAEHLEWPEKSLESRLTRFRSGVAQQIFAPDYLHRVLNTLQPRLRLGIVTNGSGEAQRSKLKVLGIEQYFDPILISEETGYRKPQPEIFRIAAERWQIPKNQILVVGDDDVADIQGAVGAGMLALRVGASGAGSAPSISSISELESWLNDNGLLG
jgi:putative hydrolase of the HAD superfamily